MKNFTSIILLFLTSISSAQVTEINVPNNFGLTVGNTTQGATIPFYQKDGYVYCISRKLTSSSGEGKIFKINQNTNQIIEIQESSPIYFNSTVSDIPQYVGEYQSKIFFRTSQQTTCGMLDISNNTFTTDYFEISNNAGNGGLIVFEDHVYNGIGQKKNINSNLISYAPTYLNELGETVAFASPQFQIVDNNLLSLQYEYSTSFGGFVTRRILQNTGVGFTTYYSAMDDMLMTLGGNKEKLLRVGDRMIYVRSTPFPYTYKLMSNPMVNGTTFILDQNTSTNGFNELFTYNNELYYYKPGDNFISKTNGYSVSNAIGLSSPESYSNFSFTSYYYPHYKFIEFNNELYMSKTDLSNQNHFVKYNGISETLIANLSPEFSIVHNGKIYFSSIANNNNNNNNYSIFSYDGNNLKQLNLGSINCQTVLLSSMFANDHYLFFGNGNSLVKIDLDTVSTSTYLSTQENNFIQPMIVYPNPSKDLISFSAQVENIIVFDLTGKQVFLNLQDNKLNISSLENGIYVLKITDTQQKVFTEKLIKE